MSKIVIVVPTFNERENLPRLVKDLFALNIPDVEILVVDDNSPDGTGQLADDLAAADPRLHVMHRAGKMGLGTAYVQGFTWALEYGADVIVQMDADFSHDPRDVPRLLEASRDADVVIGSRYVKGGKLDEKWSIWRRLLSWFANRVWVGTILQTGIADNTGGFRAWKRRTLIGLDLSRFKSNGYVFQVELTYVAIKMGYKIREIPIYFADRVMGESKMSFKVQLEAARGVLFIRQRYRDLTPANRAPGG